jgi:hypothetical protein
VTKVSIERVKADWQRVSRRYPDKVQRELVLCLRSNWLPTGEAFELLLEFTSVLRRKCCSEFARRIGRDKGNLYDWSEKQLAYELATNQHCFGFVKEKVLLFFQQERPDLFSSTNTSQLTIYQTRPCIDKILKALKESNEEFLSNITYNDITPPTGRLLASKAMTCRDIDVNWLASFTIGQHMPNCFPNATVTLCAYSLGLFNTKPSASWIINLPQSLDWEPESVHSFIIGLSYNPSVYEGLATGFIRSDVFAIVVNGLCLRFEPATIAQKVAQFEKRRGASLDDITSRLLQRQLDAIWVLSPQNRSALLLLQTLPLLAMTENEWILPKVLETVRSVLISIDRPKVDRYYDGIQRAIDWVAECLQELQEICCG